MTPDEWFEALQEALAMPSVPAAASPPLGDGERAALLDLARVAAHTSERWTAPVSTFVVGLALADLPPDERAERVRALVVRLEGPAVPAVPAADPAAADPPAAGDASGTSGTPAADAGARDA